MNRLRALLGAIVAVSLCGPLAAHAATPAPDAGPSAEVQKLNAYVGCINGFSERAFDARRRYFSWAPTSGPTGKERIIYGTYTISDPAGCQKAVEAANALEPHQSELEAAATTYVAAVVALAPLLKEADDYYDQENYKDDKMAKGKALHPRLVAAWDAFAGADGKLRAQVEVIQDRKALERLAEIERTEGRKARYHMEAVMIQAKALVRAETADTPDLAKITPALDVYESAVTAADGSVDSSFLNSAKSYLGTAKRLMRRLRDKVPYSTGEKMNLASGSGAWMVDGSPARLIRDYNDLVGSYNRGIRM